MLCLQWTAVAAAVNPLTKGDSPWAEGCWNGSRHTERLRNLERGALSGLPTRQSRGPLSASVPTAAECMLVTTNPAGTQPQEGTCAFTHLPNHHCSWMGVKWFSPLAEPLSGEDVRLGVRARIHAPVLRHVAASPPWQYFMCSVQFTSEPPEGNPNQHPCFYKHS